jgi:hypothetical protein
MHAEGETLVYITDDGYVCLRVCVDTALVHISIGLDVLTYLCFFLSCLDTLRSQITYQVTFVVWTKFICCSCPSNTYVVSLGYVPRINFSPEQIKWCYLLYVSIFVWLCIVYIFLQCYSFVCLAPAAELLNHSIVFLCSVFRVIPRIKDECI